MGEQKAKMKAWQETFIINSLAVAMIDCFSQYKSLSLPGNKYASTSFASPGLLAKRDLMLIGYFSHEQHIRHTLYPLGFPFY